MDPDDDPKTKADLLGEKSEVSELPEEPPRPRLQDVLRSLPLVDLYLGMQAFNLAVVDAILEDLETDLLAEYMQQESTPIQSTLVASAVGQLWIFGIYEFFRTWRGRARDVLMFADAVRNLESKEQEKRIADKRAEVRARAAVPDLADLSHWKAFERAAKDPAFVAAIRLAIDRSEMTFRRVEALRMYLAKHEVPKAKGSFGSAPGYGRIDMSNGSIYWQVDLGRMEVDVISRRGIADELRHLAMEVPFVVLPDRFRRDVEQLSPPNYYGFKRVRLVMEGGNEYETRVILNKQIVDFSGLPETFEANRVAKILPAIQPEPDALDRPGSSKDKPVHEERAQPVQEHVVISPSRKRKRKPRRAR